jgi:hypothetical protein
MCAKKAVNAVGITTERFGLHYKFIWNKIVLLVAKIEKLGFSSN